MIRSTTTHLNLGLRPTGLIELVDRTTGVVSFVGPEHELDGSPLDILTNPSDVPFVQRPRDFLGKVREERVALLTAHRRAKRKKGSLHDTVAETTPRPKRSTTRTTTRTTAKRAAATAALLAAGLDPATLAALGLGPPTPPR